MLWLLLLLAAAPQVGDQLTLEVGETRRLKIPGIQRVAVSGADIYVLKTLGNDEVAITGSSPGQSAILAWRSEGRRVAIGVRVVPAPVPRRPPLHSQQTAGRWSSTA